MADKLWKDMTAEEREIFRKEQAAARKKGLPASAPSALESAPPDPGLPEWASIEARPWDMEGSPETPAGEPGEGGDAEGEDEEAEGEPVTEPPPEPQSRAEARLLARIEGLPQDLREKLTAADIEEILAEERERAAQQAKKRAMDRARNEIRHQMQVEQGLLDAATLRTREQHQRLQKKVRIRFTLPTEGTGDPARGSGFRIDGHLYEPGQWHTVSMATFESIQSMHYDVWVQETQFTTLDQTRRLGITTMNQLRGTTPARAIYSAAPNRIEMQDA
jgi:hypothetical protein